MSVRSVMGSIKNAVRLQMAVAEGLAWGVTSALGSLALEPVLYVASNAYLRTR
jgi:hypothetical protein